MPSLLVIGQQRRNDQNLELNLGHSYVQFYSGGHFSERPAAAQ